MDMVSKFEMDAALVYIESFVNAYIKHPEDLDKERAEFALDRLDFFKRHFDILYDNYVGLCDCVEYDEGLETDPPFGERGDETDNDDFHYCGPKQSLEDRYKNAIFNGEVEGC